MSQPPKPSQPSAPTNPLNRIDLLCDEFEALWRSGDAPDLSQFLTGVSEDQHTELFSELLVLELGYRTDRGQTPSQAEYLERFPDFTDAIGTLFQQYCETLIEQRASDPLAATQTFPDTLLRPGEAGRRRRHENHTGIHTSLTHPTINASWS